MESVIRNVRELGSGERHVLERVLGHELNENHRLIIQLVNVANEPAENTGADNGIPSTRLPDWCDVFAGLTDEQVAEVEKVILRRSDLSRKSA